MSHAQSTPAPTGHPHHEIRDKAVLEADVLCFIGYGIDISLFILAFVLLRKRSKKEKRKTGRISWLISILEVYNCLVFVLCTLSVASKIQMMKTAYIDDRDSEGGPGLSQMKQYTSVPVGILGNISCAVTNWLVDVLLVGFDLTSLLNMC